MAVEKQIAKSFGFFVLKMSGRFWAACETSHSNKSKGPD